MYALAHECDRKLEKGAQGFVVVEKSSKVIVHVPSQIGRPLTSECRPHN
jgi:hypothetical protein